MNKNLLVATLKAMMVNNYELSIDKEVSDYYKEKYKNEAATFQAVINMIEDERHLETLAGIYEVEIEKKPAKVSVKKISIKHA